MTEDNVVQFPTTPAVAPEVAPEIPPAPEVSEPVAERAIAPEEAANSELKQQFANFRFVRRIAMDNELVIRKVEFAGEVVLAVCTVAEKDDAQYLIPLALMVHRDWEVKPVTEEAPADEGNSGK
jgi:hypothetical protein